MDNKRDVIMSKFFAFVALLATIAYYCVYIFPAENILVYGGLLLFFIIYSIKSKLSKQCIKNAALFTVFFVSLYFVSFLHGFLPVNIQWLFLFFGFAFLCSKEFVQYKTLNYFIRVLAFLFAISIVEFIAYAFWGISLINIPIDRGGRPYTNLVFNVIDNQFLVVFPRFQSLLDEPGMVGTLSALILSCIWRLKGRTFEKMVFIAAGTLSFSLAFFFLLTILVVLNLRFRIKYLIIILVSVALAYFLLYEYFEELVLFRFENNRVLSRTAETFDLAFDKAWNNGQLWWGLGATSEKLVTELGEGNAGIKVWIYQFGIIGLVFYFLLYMKLMFSKMKKNGKINKTFIVLIILLWLSFIQRSDIEAPYYIVILFGFPAFYKYEYLDKQSQYGK